MSEEKKPTRKGRKPAEGDKRQILLTIDPEVIKRIKLAAIEDDSSASAAMEEAAREWLERRASKAKKASEK
jgi:Ribbon-helix-helix protein, copG family